jgi:mono/diheme cytochrome c family protein
MWVRPPPPAPTHLDLRDCSDRALSDEGFECSCCVAVASFFTPSGTSGALTIVVPVEHAPGLPAAERLFAGIGGIELGMNSYDQPRATRPDLLRRVAAGAGRRAWNTGGRGAREAAMMGVPLALVMVTLASAIGWGCGRAPEPPARGATARPESAPSDSAEVTYSAARLPIPALGYNALERRALYWHYCLTCHGEEGNGDGFNAYNLDPKPRSLADLTFLAQHSDADLEAVIRSGGGAVGLSTGMPPWGRTLSERQIRNIMEYVRTLPATEQAPP